MDIAFGDKRSKAEITAEHRSLLETFRVAIFETIPDPLLVLDSHYNTLTANEGFYKHFKVTPEETIDRSIYEIGNGQWNIPGLKLLLEKVLPEKSVIKEFEVTFEFPSIGKRTMLVNAREISSSKFLPLDLILIAFVDVTDRKKWTDSILELNEKLKTSNEDLERLGHTLSHDLRAPVRVMAGFAKMILDDYGSELSDDLKEYISRVEHSAETMDKMISGLSQLAGLSRLPVNNISISLTDIADTIISQLKSNDPNRLVDVSIEQNMIEAVEPSMFLIVLTNLLRNSWKFTRGQSPAKITFGVKEKNGMKIYFVKDNGAGFDMKYAHKLFEMFQRLHSEKEFEGTGTGLAIVKSIINKHGGEIWADSAIGKGTTIFFTIGRRVE